MSVAQSQSGQLGNEYKVAILGIGSQNQGAKEADGWWHDVNRISFREEVEIVDIWCSLHGSGQNSMSNGEVQLSRSSTRDDIHNDQYEETDSPLIGHWGIQQVNDATNGVGYGFKYGVWADGNFPTVPIEVHPEEELHVHLEDVNDNNVRGHFGIVYREV